MNQHDATEIAYKNGFEAGKKVGINLGHDWEGFCVMELEETISNQKEIIEGLKEEIKELRRELKLETAMSEILQEAKRIGIMVETDISARRHEAKRKEASWNNAF